MFPPLRRALLGATLAAVTGLTAALVPAAPAHAWAPPPGQSAWVNEAECIFEYNRTCVQLLEGPFWIRATYTSYEACLTNEGQRIVLRTCNAANQAQRWRFVPYSAANNYIKWEIWSETPVSRQEMTVHGGSTASGALIDGWFFVAGADNQRFFMEKILFAFQRHYFRIRPAHSGKCANLQGASEQPGTPLIQWTCVTASNEVFWLQAIT